MAVLAFVDGDRSAPSRESGRVRGRLLRSAGPRHRARVLPVTGAGISETVIGRLASLLSRSICCLSIPQHALGFAKPTHCNIGVEQRNSVPLAPREPLTSRHPVHRQMNKPIIQSLTTDGNVSPRSTRQGGASAYGIARRRSRRSRIGELIRETLAHLKTTASHEAGRQVPTRELCPMLRFHRQHGFWSPCDSAMTRETMRARNRSSRS